MDHGSTHDQAALPARKGLPGGVLFYFARDRPPRPLLRSTLCSRDLESLHFSIQPFGPPAAPAGLGPPRVLMLMLMVFVVMVRSHALGRYCFLLHHKSINSSQFSVLHYYCVSGRMSLVMAISDGNIIVVMPPQ